MTLEKTLQRVSRELYRVDDRHNVFRAAGKSIRRAPLKVREQTCPILGTLLAHDGLQSLEERAEIIEVGRELG